MENEPQWPFQELAANVTDHSLYTPPRCTLERAAFMRQRLERRLTRNAQRTSKSSSSDAAGKLDDASLAALIWGVGQMELRTGLHAPRDASSTPGAKRSKVACSSKASASAGKCKRVSMRDPVTGLVEPFPRLDSGDDDDDC
jgi:hypothetical protein